MDQLPGKGLVRAFNVGAEGSMQAAGAPWAALGGLGEIIAATGEKGIAMLNKHKELQVQREAADMEIEFDQLQQDYELEMLQNPNLTPEQAIQGWQKRAEGFQAKYQRDGMSPMEQDHLATRSKELTLRGGFGVLRSSTIAGIQNAKIAAGNLIQKGEMTGNEEMRQRGLSQLRNIVPGAEADRVEMESNTNSEIARVRSEITAAPLQTQAMLDEKNDDGTWKHYQNINPAQRENLREATRTEYKRSMADAWENSQNLMADGKITTPEQIDRNYKDVVSPAVLERMKSDLAERTDDKLKTMRSLPEYQQKTVAKVQTMLSRYNPRAKGFDEQFVEMDSLIRTLPPGAAKEELSKQIDAVRKDKTDSLTSSFDIGKKAMQAAFDHGRFGGPKKSEPMDVDRVLNSGFLSDVGNLKSLGLSDEAAKSVAEATEAAGENKGKVTHAAQKRALQALAPYWNKRGSVTATPLAQAAAEAIMNGDSKIDYVSPESIRDQAAAAVESNTRYGKALMDYDEWHKANPEAKPDEINAKIFDLSGEHVRVQASMGILGTKPVKASAGARITSYGYADDSTPDRNSSAGIGAWVGDEEAARIRAGKDTPNKLKDGDFAVSPDEEALLREAGINPG